MTICKVVNCICCIPFVIVLIIYLTRIKEWNYSKSINTMLGGIVCIMNLSYVIQIPKDEKSFPCQLQGSLYVSGLVTIIMIAFFISILFFMITISPQTIDQNRDILFLSWIAICLVIFIGTFFIFLFASTFNFLGAIDACRLKKDELAYKFFWVIIIVLIVGCILVTLIVLIFGKKISKTENDYLKFRKKLSTSAIIQILSLSLLLVNRASEKFDDSKIFNKVMDLLLTLSFTVMVCVNCYNKQTREDIQKILNLTNNKEIERTNQSKPEDENLFNFMRSSPHPQDDDD